LYYLAISSSRLQVCSNIVSVSGDGCYRPPLVRLRLCQCTIMGQYSIQIESLWSPGIGWSTKRNSEIYWELTFLAVVLLCIWQCFPSRLPSVHPLH